MPKPKGGSIRCGATGAAGATGAVGAGAIGAAGEGACAADGTPKLSLVATPIGNLGDMTSRAVEALRQAGAVFCEDTRVTGKLLSALGIEGAHSKLRRLDENAISRDGARDVLAVLTQGGSAAYCSDAGMPGVSDPGSRLVCEVRAAGFAVEVLPGASAVECAFVASGTSAQAYLFGGFFPRKQGEREQLLASLASLDAALVFYESPKRIASALESVAEAFPLREVAVCRELTKLHEEVVRGCAADVAAEFAARDAGVKGEIALVVDPPSASELDACASASLDAARELAALLAGSGGVDKREAVDALRRFCGISRNDAYDIALEAFK